MAKNPASALAIKLPTGIQRTVEHIAQSQKITVEQVILNALQNYIRNLENEALHKLESHFVKALDEQTTRIGAFLAKIAVDNRTIMRILARDCNPEFAVFCRNEALNTIIPVLTEAERHHFDELSELSRTHRLENDAHVSQT